MEKIQKENNNTEPLSPIDFLTNKNDKENLKETLSEILIKLTDEDIKNITFDMMIWLNNTNVDQDYKKLNLYNYERVKFLIEEKNLKNYINTTRDKIKEYIFLHNDLNSKVNYNDSYIPKSDDNLEFYIGLNLVNNRYDIRDITHIKTFNGILCKKIFTLNKYNELILSFNFDLLKGLEISIIENDDVADCILFYREELFQTNMNNKLDYYFDIPILKLIKESNNKYVLPSLFNIPNDLIFGIKVIYKNNCMLPVDNRNVILNGIILNNDYKKAYHKLQNDFFNI